LGSDVHSLFVGRGRICALLKDDTVKCLGANSNGQLGLGDTTTRQFPETVTALGTDVRSLALGGGSYHSCAVLKDDTAKCWGYNSNGQLGLGDTTDRYAPTSVTALGSNVAALALGVLYSCALLKDGSVKCWGQNNYGQLGLGDQTDRYTPTAVSALGTDVAALAPTFGWEHGCALLKDETIKCWGQNNYGQFGLGDTTSRYTPTAVPALGTDVAQLSVGGQHSCMLLKDGTTKCAGMNRVGGLGLGTTGGTMSTFTTITALGTDVAAISTGYQFSCALMTDKTVKCWGNHASGQLGLGDETNQNTPTLVPLA